MSADRPEHPTLSTSLLAGAKQMDTESWSRLVSTFGPVVYGWARAAGVKESDAADLVQNVFVTVARGIPSFERKKEVGSFRSWLATITRSRVRDHFRRQAKRGEDALGGTAAMEQMQRHPDAANDLDSSICPDSALGTIQRRVMKAVQAEFEDSTWHAFWLLAVENKTGREVADQLGMSVASVYQAKSRVLRRMRKRLEELPQ